jgi:hypothetical protein
MHLLVSLLIAAVVKDPGSILRSGCDAQAPAVAKLEAGTELRVRYSVSGGKAPCYKVSTAPGETAAEGYLSWSAIGGLEKFEDARQQGAAQISTPEHFHPIIKTSAAKTSRDEQIVGRSVLLRYDGGSVSIDTARQMAATVDQEFARISAQLGCSTREPIVTVAQTPEEYRESSGTAQWSGGHFDGQIHLPVAEHGKLEDLTRQALTREIAHACLTMMGQWPVWLQEGIAQYISGEQLSNEGRERVAKLAHEKKLPALSSLGDEWSKLDADGARLAYDHALRAIEVFNQDFGTIGLRNLLHDPGKVPQYAAEIDRRLAQ